MINRIKAWIHRVIAEHFDHLVAAERAKFQAEVKAVKDELHGILVHVFTQDRARFLEEIEALHAELKSAIAKVGK